MKKVLCLVLVIASLLGNIAIAEEDQTDLYGPILSFDNTLDKQSISKLFKKTTTNDYTLALYVLWVARECSDLFGLEVVLVHSTRRTCTYTGTASFT